MSSKPERKAPADRRARAAALREQAERAQRGRRRLIVLAVSIVVLAVVAGITVLVRSSGGPSSSRAEPAIPTSPMKTASGSTTAPPWAAPGDPGVRVKVAGLPMLGEEGNVEHIHAHLDVLVDGKPVAVPGAIGIDQQAQKISPLHTHDTDGVIHVESPVKATFSLGQFMTEWNVALTQDSIGGLKAGGGNDFHAYVNGKEYAGNPAAIEFRAHDEIALVYGPAGQETGVPSSYDWPEGE